MITEIEVSGFKSLRNVKIPLSPGINVFVGANNSGKSNALAVLKYLKQLTLVQYSQEALDSLGGFQRVVSRGMDRFSCSITNKIQETCGRYEITRASRLDASLPATRERVDITEGSHKKAWSSTDDHKILPVRSDASLVDGLNFSLVRHIRRESPPAVNSLFQEISNIKVLDFSIPSIRAESELQVSAELAPDGTNLAAVIDVLANTKPDLLEAVEREIRLVTNVKRILSPPGSTPGKKVVGIQELDGSVFEAGQISDGVLLFIATSVATQIAGAQPSLIAFEEPERGIHPRRIREVVDQFRRIAAKGTQVILTTHSPILLEEFRDFPESVLIFDRDKDGTHVQRLSDHPSWREDIVGDVSLGDIWYSGILGGVPK